MEFKTELFEYQKKCVDKLRKIKVNAIYSEMGTGKTRMVLELAKIRLDRGRVNHIIWLCPCSVKENLKREIIKHTGSEQSDLITICGIESLSTSIRLNSELLKLVEDNECFLIVDESNLIKNIKAKRTINILRLAEKCTYKAILNGTPISRNEADLFAQWYVLDWRILGYRSYWSFAANHIEYDEKRPGFIRRCLNTNYLSEKIAPYTYQVLKKECLDLPDKIYKTEYYHLTDEQDKHYEQVANDLLFDVEEMKPHTIYKLFAGLQNVISGYEVDTSEINLSKKPFFENPKDNPRIDLFMNIIDRFAFDEKVIIFCKYTDEINIIVKLLNEKYGDDMAVSFNGELSLKEREISINKFTNKSRFFVANKQCASYGLNLQFCSNIIYYSNDWDYATRGQSEDRVHRIGQNNKIQIIDICASYTLDERILNCLRKKENLVYCFKKEMEKLKDRKDLISSWIKIKKELINLLEQD